MEIEGRQDVAREIEALRAQLKPFDEGSEIAEIQAVEAIEFPENGQVLGLAKELHARFSLDPLMEKLAHSNDF